MTTAATTPPSDDERNRRDLGALQGRWAQVGMEADGVVDPIDDVGEPGALTTIEGQRFMVHAVDGRLLLEGRFELDATVSPAAITWIDAIGPDRGKRLPASYMLEGDRFTFIAADEGMPRPTAFTTGPGQTLRRFVRR